MTINKIARSVLSFVTFFEIRMSHLNRYLIDYEYGGIASRVHGFVPKYGNEDVFGERMKRVWPKIVQERGLVVQNK